jgi:PAS domain S-box-containing protein
MVARTSTLPARSSRSRRGSTSSGNGEALRRVCVLDALPASLALLDSFGAVVAVNEPWKRFAAANGFEGPAGLGLNYLEVTERAAPEDPEGAGRVASALREVLNGRRHEFSLEYPCHSPTTKRWFRVDITGVFDAKLGNGALVLHHDITKRWLADEKAWDAERRYRTVFDLHFQFLAILSPEGEVIDINELALQVGGVRREQIVGHPLWQTVWWTQLPGIQEWWAALLQSAATSPQSLHREGVYNTSSGETREVEITLTAGRDALGALAYFILQGVDTTEKARETRARKAADIELARTNRALKMLTACNEALIRATAESSLLQCVCQIAVDVGGYQRASVGYADEDEGRTIVVRAQAGPPRDLMSGVPHTWASNHEGDTGPTARAILSGRLVVVDDLSVEPVLAQVATRIRDAGLISGVFLPLKDAKRTFGVLALYSLAATPLGDDEIKLLGELADDLAFGIGSLRAHAERNLAEVALVASLGEKEALLQEVHHRVNNNLQVITSLLRLEGSRVAHAATKAVLKDMQNRIQSMAALHETLYRSGNFADVNLADYLRQITRQLRRSLAEGRGQIEFHLDLEQIRLDMDRAVPCGLILNELVSNSLKHAFPGGRSGSIWLGLHEVGSDSGRLEVRDDGVGFLGDPDTTPAVSLGLQMVSDLARQMSGTFLARPGDKAQYCVTFPRHRSAGLMVQLSAVR